MSLIETIAVFSGGIILGAYGAYLAHPLIEAGVSLMKLRKEEKKIEATLKTTNAEPNAATQPAAENTTLRPTPTSNHSTTNQEPTKKLRPTAPTNNQQTQPTTSNAANSPSTKPNPNAPPAQRAAAHETKPHYPAYNS